MRTIGFIGLVAGALVLFNPEWLPLPHILTVLGACYVCLGSALMFVIGGDEDEPILRRDE
jgi:hypothetical protein